MFRYFESKVKLKLPTKKPLISRRKINEFIIARSQHAIRQDAEIA
jgi:hypothetical protein